MIKVELMPGDVAPACYVDMCQRGLFIAAWNVHLHMLMCVSVWPICLPFICVPDW